MKSLWLHSELEMGLNNMRPCLWQNKKQKRDLEKPRCGCLMEIVPSEPFVDR